MICPFSRTKMTSTFLIVERRCAIIREVFHSISSSSDFWISISVLLSRAEVASSSIKISGFFKNILAMLIRCFSPHESLTHLSPISV
jgi:hypothetical protein